MLRSKILWFAIISGVSAVAAFANPDSVLIGEGDLRITGSGSGLVFPDGSIQYKATIQGPAGPQGPTGPAGPANTLSIGTVNGGAQAASTITGTAPHQILNLTLPQGPQGPPGQVNLAAICDAITAGNAPLPPFCTLSARGSIRLGDGTPLAGITIALGGRMASSTQTETAGNYYFSNLVNGSYTITPGSSKYSFTPASLTLTMNSTNVAGQDFVATLVSTPAIILGGYHQVGDGLWGSEPVNSQLEAGATSGRSYSELFTLADQPQQFAFATITFAHKGMESSAGYQDALIVNSTAIPLDTSNSDGSFTTFSAKVPSSIFLSNCSNVINVESGVGNDPGELNNYDDFGFKDITIQFSN